MNASEVVYSSTPGPRLEVRRRLSEVVETYLRYCSVQGFTEQTLATYSKELKWFLKWIGAVDLEDVSKLDLMAYLEACKARGLAPRTIYGRHGTLRAFFGWTVDWDLLPESPMAKLKPPRVPRRRKGFITKEQWEGILAICPSNTFTGARRQVMFRLLSSTGCRLNEMYMLRLSDLEANRIRIVWGKGQKERFVTYSKDLNLAVMKYLFLRGKDDHPGLWVSEERRPMTYYGLRSDVTRMLKRAGVVVKDNAHAFRRTWAANAIRQGIPRPYVGEEGGWATLTMVDRYTEAMQGEDEAREAFRDFDPWA